jgi:hypothetical protein
VGGAPPTPLVLAAADLGWWRDPADEWALRSAVLEALNLDSSQFLLNFSHTHAGPVLCRADADKPGGHLIGPYLDFLRDTVIATAKEALQQATETTLDWAYGACSVAVNRDLPDPRGSGRYLAGFNPNEPADDTLLLGRISGEASLLVNYACHPTTLAFENRLISPDFIGKLRQRLIGDICEDVLFLQGASGEVAPREQYTADTKIADWHGSQVANSVYSAWGRMLSEGKGMTYRGVVESGAPLAIWEQVPIAYSRTLKAVQVEMELPLKPEWQGETEEERRWEASNNPADRERLRRRLRIRLALGGKPTATIPLWVWQVGDAFFVASPTEAYSQLQTELRATFPHTAIVVMNVTNGWWGYLPPADLYDRDMYSVWQTPFAAGSLEILIQTAKDTITGLANSDS